MRWLAAALWLLPAAAWAQPVCVTQNSLPCFDSSTGLQSTDVIYGTQQSGPARANQTVKVPISQVLGLNHSSSLVTAGSNTQTLATWASYLNGTTNPNPIALGSTLGVGGTFTVGGGTLTSNIMQVINGTASGARKIQWQTSGSGRFDLGLENTGEPGGGTNGGSDLIIQRRDDNGAILDQPFSIDRATGSISILNDIRSGTRILLNSFSSNKTLSGSSNQSVINGVFNLSGSYSGAEGMLQFSNATDTAAITGNFGYPYINATRQFGGTGMDGPRGVAIFSLIHAQPMSASTGSDSYITTRSFFTSQANAGGTGLTGGLSSGAGYAMYPQAILAAGATNYTIVSLAEGDIGVTPTTRPLVVSGTLVNGDVNTLTFTSAAIVGSPISVTYTTGTGNANATIVNGLMAAVMSNSALRNAGVSAMQTSGNTSSLTLSWPTQNTVTISATTTGSGSLTLGTTVTGASAKIRKGLSITRAGPDGAQGVEQDAALEFGALTVATQGGQWRNTLLFGPVTAIAGTMIGANDQTFFSTNGTSAPFQRLWAAHGLDFHLVNFSIAGGDSISVPGARFGATGNLHLRTTTFSATSTGTSIDVSGFVGSATPSIVSGGGGGSGQDANRYFVGDLVKDAIGGQYQVSTVDSSTGAVTALTTLVQPFSASAFGVGIATTGGSGTGLTITPTSNVVNVLQLNPTTNGPITTGGQLQLAMPNNIGTVTTGVNLGRIGFNQTTHGTFTGGTGGLVLNVNNTEDITANAGEVSELQITHSFGGAAMTGERNTFLLSANLNATSGNVGTNGNFTGTNFAAMQVGASTFATDNGTGGSPAGGITVLNLVGRVRTGVQNWSSVNGMEIDIAVEGGGTPATIRDKYGQTLSHSVSDAVAASRYEVAWGIANGGGPIGTTVGWKQGIVFGQGGFFSLAANATVIYAAPFFAGGDITPTVLNFLDWSQVQTTGSLFTDGTSSLTGNAAATPGLLTVNKIKVVSLPTSCSGQPTGTFINSSGVVNVCP